MVWIESDRPPMATRYIESQLHLGKDGECRSIRSVLLAAEHELENVDWKIWWNEDNGGFRPSAGSRVVCRTRFPPIANLSSIWALTTSIRTFRLPQRPCHSIMPPALPYPSRDNPAQPTNIQALAIDLLNRPAEVEARTHKLKKVVPEPNSFFMDVKCPGCFQIT